MVEILCYSPTVLPQDVQRSMPPVPNRLPFGAQGRKMMTREEHQLKEMNLRKMGLRRGPPKRSATVQNFAPLSEMTGTQPAITLTAYTTTARGEVVSQNAVPRTMPYAPAEPAKLAPAAAQRLAPLPASEIKKTAPRPGMGPTRRSYSVMDYEPVPKSEQPSKGIRISDLPTELHYAIFENLDPIDSMCIGLTSRHFYAMHKQCHGSEPMALSTRRQGPNNVEWAWRLANQITNLSIHPEHVEKAISHLEEYAIRGATYCRKCGANKCELHRHIKEWMGSEWEYCSIVGKFSRPAPEGSKDHCYRRKPTDPHACGRHRKRRPGITRVTTI